MLSSLIGISLLALRARCSIVIQAVSDNAVYIDSTTVILNRTDSNTALAPVRSPSKDVDIGPWCKFNKTSRTLLNGPEIIWPVYNYTMPNSTCGVDATCSLPGCVMYRETQYKSGIQSWEGCSVVFPWWYATGPAGNRTSTPCPLFDNQTSTFTFRGKEYYNLMFNYGHSYGPADCHKNILCSTSAIWFDDTQYSTLKWCQPTPVGWYSPQCNNTKFMCDSGGVDMSTKYYYTHGMGSSLGCGIRLTAPAFAFTSNSLTPTTNPTFLISVDVEMVSSSPSASGMMVLVGLFPKYFLGILPIGTSGNYALSLYHSNYTVFPTSSYLVSDPFPWSAFTAKTFAVQSDGTSISFWVDRAIMGMTRISPSTASIGNLNMTGLPSNYTDGSLIHLGFFSAGLSTDFVDSTTALNPYTTGVFADMKLSGVQILGSAPLTTTTTSTTISTSTTTFEPTSTTTVTTTTVAPLTTTTNPTTTTVAPPTTTTTTAATTTTTPIAPSTSTMTTATTVTTSIPTTMSTTMTISPTTSTVSTSTTVTTITPTTTTTTLTTTIVPATTTESTTRTTTSEPFVTTVIPVMTTTTSTSAEVSTTLVPTTTTSTTPTTITTTSSSTTVTSTSVTTTALTSTTTAESSTTSTTFTTLALTSTATENITTATPTTTDRINTPSQSTVITTETTSTTASTSSSDVSTISTSSATSTGFSTETDLSTSSTVASTYLTVTITSHQQEDGASRTGVIDQPAPTTEAKQDSADRDIESAGLDIYITAGLALGVVVIILITLCICRYKCNGFLTLARRGSRRVESITNYL